MDRSHHHAFWERLRTRSPVDGHLHTCRRLTRSVLILVAVMAVAYLLKGLTG